ncbi:hypothetical protein U4E84_15985 [Halorubrum sp. AD140]|uniref:DUF7504 family protein n=1 Tax=Halorubrum sp. AD140 TaxID=3050073 RepID=UPI002ACCB28D|nr:hypothetical protein [Halorubrum sp. AD140]MDZ5812844.1 hypothetical protein [Halorubrum sp. AD140]
MATPSESDYGVTVRLSATGQPPARDGPVPDRVVSVLFETGIEEWRRGWRRSPGTGPSQEAIVAASDTTRGATATTQVVPGGRLAYTVLGAPVDLDRVAVAVSEHVDGVRGTAPTVIVDDLAPVLTGRERADVEPFAETLREGFGGSVNDVVVGCTYRPEIAADLGALFDPIEEVGRVDHPVRDAFDRLRREDPTTFGYVRRHWFEAWEGIRRCDRNYPQSRQVHAALEQPATTPRTLGATLSGLVRLGVLETWGDTVGPTRYDLTAYDADRMWLVGAAIASSGGRD